MNHEEKLTTEQARIVALAEYVGESVFLDADGFLLEGDEEDEIQVWKNDYKEEYETFAGYCTYELSAFTGIQASSYDDCTLDYDGCEYLVLTDSEADGRWNDSLDDYINECILPEIPEAYHNYFDRKGWKDDAYNDGRGHTLSPYDGNEYEGYVNNIDYYIFRIN